MGYKVIRNKEQSKRSTLGKLFIDDVFECYTLEPPKEAVPPPEGNGFAAIPEGMFTFKIYWSRRWNEHVPHIDNVPGRSAIEMHIGNYPRDTDGCTVVGTEQSVPDMVQHSAMAFQPLLAKLFERATLTNPDEEYKKRVWDLGTITYESES